ncbi:MAG: hypothetical protein LC118_00495 [Dehalococcoidia bacterium]|nr:hypothetical protein [Dehalococcoidia bacterium]
MAAIGIDTFLRAEGFEDEQARAAARLILEGGGLTNPRKQAMDESKLERARALLESFAVRICSSDCRSLAPRGGATLLVVSAERCQVCEGSNNRRAALLLARAMRSARASKLLVVGGTGTLHRELQGLLAPAGIEARCVDGAAHTPSQKAAWADQRWADVVVIWASTPLPHKVSELYTREPIGRPPITVARRGIAALCTELRTSLDRHGL